MNVDLDRSMALLERTPRTLTAWLSGLPPESTHGVLRGGVARP